MKIPTCLRWLAAIASLAVPTLTGCVAISGAPVYESPDLILRDTKPDAAPDPEPTLRKIRSIRDELSRGLGLVDERPLVVVIDRSRNGPTGPNHYDVANEEITVSTTLHAQPSDEALRHEIAHALLHRRFGELYRQSDFWRIEGLAEALTRSVWTGSALRIREFWAWLPCDGPIDVPRGRARAEDHYQRRLTAFMAYLVHRLDGDLATQFETILHLDDASRHELELAWHEEARTADPTAELIRVLQDGTDEERGFALVAIGTCPWNKPLEAALLDALQTCEIQLVGGVSDTLAAGGADPKFQARTLVTRLRTAGDTQYSAIVLTQSLAELGIWRNAPDTQLRFDEDGTIHPDPEEAQAARRAWLDWYDHVDERVGS